MEQPEGLPLVAYTPPRGRARRARAARERRVGQNQAHRLLVRPAAGAAANALPGDRGAACARQRADAACKARARGVRRARARGGGAQPAGPANRISRYFSPEEIIPAAGQAILAVQGRAGELEDAVRALDDADARDCAIAERSFVKNAWRRVLRAGSRPMPRRTRGAPSARAVCLGGRDPVRARRGHRGAARSGLARPHAGFAAQKTGGGRAMTGKVTLVGAGPGGRGLLTIAGAQAIARADAVVYDRLVDEDILGLIPEGAERVNVGKENNHHPVPQDQINEILVQLAKAGQAGRAAQGRRLLPVRPRRRGVRIPRWKTMCRLRSSRV